jgi:hypothetical protein
MRGLGNLTQSATAAGVSRATVFRWQEADEQFGLAFHQAEAEALELLEQEARTRATRGPRSSAKCGVGIG